MIAEIINKWDLNKNKLECFFKETNQDEYDDYTCIVKKIFELVINDSEGISYNLDNLTVIDNGDYQGTLIFIIPEDTYQPDIDNYLVTNTYYGSCSGCDTLQGINVYGNEKPTDEQVKEYMTLSLHLIQKMKYLKD